MGIHLKHKPEIDSVVESIDNSLKNSSAIPQAPTPSPEKYFDLLNVYKLYANNFPLYSTHIFGRGYKEMLSYVPFAINALTLTGRLPKANANGIDTSKGLYPLHLRVIKKEKLEAKKGIKISDRFFPYKPVSKLYQGDTGNNTFLATDGSRSLFMRGVEHCAFEGIFASKIATLISPEHFASERLMDNRIVASRALPTYARSVADQSTRDERKKYIEEDLSVFPGTGIIDEVLNYIVETDINIENFGFSSNIIQEAHLSKIDFDRCRPNSPTSKDRYDMSILTKPNGGIYHGLPHVQTNEQYLKEKLRTRLKLSMLTEPLLQSLADQAFSDENDKIKKESISASFNRSDIALELFVEHPEAKNFFLENLQVITECHTEIVAFVEQHLASNTHETILQSLEERIRFIRSKIAAFNLINALQPNTQGQEAGQGPQQEHVQRYRSKLAASDLKEYYMHQVDSNEKGRFHLFTAQGNSLAAEFKGLKGDYLKSRILLQLKDELSLISSEEGLEEFKQKMQTDPRVKILEKNQGISRFFGLKTSSIIALNKMIKEQENIINTDYSSDSDAPGKRKY